MQLAFDFPSQEKYLAEDFIISGCNQSAWNFTREFNSDNPLRIFAIVGKNKSGKTYLANIWAKKFDAEFLNLKELETVNLLEKIQKQKFYIIEDVDEVQNQELLLHILNLITEKSAFLMVTSSINLSQINFVIKDLESRLKTLFELEILSPDDNFIKILLIKIFAEKQLNVEAAVIDFLVKNLDRSFEAVFDAVKLLEFYSLEKRRNITIPLLKEVLKNKF